MQVLSNIASYFLDDKRKCILINIKIADISMGRSFNERIINKMQRKYPLKFMKLKIKILAEFVKGTFLPLLGIASLPVSLDHF